MSQEPEFSRLRAFFWPVHRRELRRFLPMLLMFFLICFNYNILRASKDSLIVTAPHSGAETLPFLKVWAILPMALFMTYLFSKLSNAFSKEKVFYVMMAIFLSFFLLFAFVLYPNRELLHPHAFADRLQEYLPMGSMGFVAILRNWTYTSFYMMAEMWSTIMMSVLFWGFANDVTSVKSAKRFYALLGIGANFSGTVSGMISTFFSRHTFSVPFIPNDDAWGQSIVLLTCIVIVSGLCITYLFRWMNVEGMGYKKRDLNPKNNKPKIKMGLMENFSYLAKSKYLMNIAVIVVMYNICINLVEVVWKNQVKGVYPDPASFNAYIGQVQTATGIFATLIAIFVSGNVIRKFSWSFSAMITPMVILVTGVGFFSFILFQDMGLGVIASFLGTTPIMVSVFFGSMQNCLARASKYTLFDSTKELAFIPLSEECKLKGKAAIDGVGSRLGKSGGSIIYQMLLMTFGTLASSAAYVGGLLLVVIGAWIYSTRALGRQFNELTREHEILTIADDHEEIAKTTPLKPVPNS